jgi:hypothetical protein
MAALTEEERGKLGAEDFAVPHKRMLPIHDEGHARQAWNELDRTGGLDTFEKEEARHRIVRALHRFGVSFPGVEEERRSLTEGGDPEGKRLADAGHTLEAVIIEDAQGGHVVEVTIARPGVSQNGYIYSESVLREGTSLWNGAPAFLDHPTALDLTRAGSRSLRDLVGVYEGAVYHWSLESMPFT